MTAMTAMRAGLIYAAAVFAVGSVLGVIRILVLVPAIGATAAVAVEVPVMLAAAWLICGAVLGRIAVRQRVGDRLLMGATALALLWLAETGVAVVLGMTPGAFLRSLATAAGVLGLAAQLVFALFPLIRRTRA